MTADIDAGRLLKDLEDLSHIGGRPDGGVDRTAWSDADLEARAWLMARIEAFGWQVERDAAWNVFGRAPDARPRRLLVGSHTDSVAAGGRLDGAYGVVAALEVARTLAAAGHPAAAALEIVDFADEEGVRFPCGYLGSKALTAGLQVESLRSSQDLLEAAGVNFEGLTAASSHLENVAGCLEIHIEQGPRLEKEGLRVGVATGILGFDRYEVVIDGRSEHGGTTPFAMRADPMVAAASFITEIADLVSTEGDSGTATVGSITADGGAINFVARTVRFSLEIRQESPAALTRSALTIRNRLEAICATNGCTAEMKPHEHVAQEKDGVALAVEPAFSAPVEFDRRLVRACEQACVEIGAGHRRMPAGTWHDAGVMAAHRPSAMLLVPSHRGMTHSPLETTADEHLVMGARALLRASVLAVEALGISPSSRSDPAPRAHR